MELQIQVFEVSGFEIISKITQVNVSLLYFLVSFHFPCTGDSRVNTGCRNAELICREVNTVDQGISYHFSAYRNSGSAPPVLREDKGSLNMSFAVQCLSPAASSIWSFAFLLRVTYIDLKLLLTYFSYPFLLFALLPN